MPLQTPSERQVTAEKSVEFQQEHEHVSSLCGIKEELRTKQLLFSDSAVFLYKPALTHSNILCLKMLNLNHFTTWCLINSTSYCTVKGGCTWRSELQVCNEISTWTMSFVKSFFCSSRFFLPLSASPSVTEIIHNFQSAIRLCLTVIEFWYEGNYSPFKVICINLKY